MIKLTLAAVLAAIHLLKLHGPDGQTLIVNVDEISSLREPRDTEGHFAPDVHCLLIMTNGKLNAVTETCEDVAAAIQR
jgi:hypothetical protein